MPLAAMRRRRWAGDQPYSLFKQLWAGTSVERHLWRNGQLARRAAGSATMLEEAGTAAAPASALDAEVTLP